VVVDPACAALYPPTFANVYETTLRVGCGSALGACHAAGGAGRMSLASPAEAHEALLAGRVTPGDPGCSELIVRTHAEGASYAMPPGASLAPAERCALVRWVAAGAPGPATAAGAR
jgi:hypothetical protein